MIALLLAASLAACRPVAAYDVGVAWLHGGIVVKRTIPASARVTPPPLLEIDPATGATTQLPFLTNGWAFWAPDEREVALMEPSALQVEQTRLLAPDGTQVAVLRGASDVAWSPDGARLAYTIGFPAPFPVHVVAADGTGDRTLGYGRLPSWSPDGTQLAIQDNGWISIVDVATGAERRLVRGDAPRWSPRGDWIAYTTRTGVAVVRADGSSAHRLTRGAVLEVAWSPDGNRLAVAFARRVGVVAVASRRLRLVSGDGMLPVWSPNGAQIAFTARGEVWLANVRTLRAQPLVPLC